MPELATIETEKVQAAPWAEKKLTTLTEDFLAIQDEGLADFDPSEPYWDINLQRKSWVWCFIKRRGGGKTTALSYFAAQEMALHNMRCVANYPLEFIYAPNNRPPYRLCAEPLDFYKLMVKDNAYENCLILLDEAPDIISHLAAITWKNRLLNVFTRAIRHNRNSLFMAAQEFEEIDKGMRRQTDILIECEDAATKYGEHDYPDGSLVLLRFLDRSGQWTSKSYEEEIEYNKAHGIFEDVGTTYSLYPSTMWGDESHKPVYDSWYKFDVFETLRKVDLKLSSYKISEQGNDEADKYPVTNDKLKSALEMIETVCKERSDSPAIYQKEYYQSLGGITDTDKNNLGKVLSRFGVERGGDGAKRWYSFKDFDIESFREYIRGKGQK